VVGADVGQDQAAPSTSGVCQMNSVTVLSRASRM
jgi:hypothetical protein